MRTFRGQPAQLTTVVKYFDLTVSPSWIASAFYPTYPTVSFNHFLKEDTDPTAEDRMRRDDQQA